VSARFIVRLASEIANHPLPPKILLAQDPFEPLEHVLLKLLACVIFQRDRLQIEPRLHDDNIPFIPDLIQLDYELRPALWIECGETSAAKLDKLAVKAPLSELWIVLRSAEEMEAQVKEMRRLELRRNRYRLLGFEAAIFDELLALLTTRNELMLYRLDFEERLIQLDFNGVWFEGGLVIESF
jgi:uncharacterized protein YaeQ